MAFEEPTQNKMIDTPPAKKEFHFAATAEHIAEVVHAYSTAEAEAIYHKIKRPIATVGGTVEEPVEQSTGAIDENKTL